MITDAQRAELRAKALSTYSAPMPVAVQRPELLGLLDAVDEAEAEVGKLHSTARRVYAESVQYQANHDAEIKSLENSVKEANRSSRVWRELADKYKESLDGSIADHKRTLEALDEAAKGLREAQHNFEHIAGKK